MLLKQEQDLNNKSDPSHPAKFADRSTALSDESGVTDDNVTMSFPGASVSTGRTGQTGGGTNAVSHASMCDRIVLTS